LMSDRYKRCHAYSSTDYHNWLVALKQAGYATAKNYVQLCEQLIKCHKLYLYDRLAVMQ
jgi:flagellum-specific peptidoglycan hydrolase FlgJ